MKTLGILVLDEHFTCSLDMEEAKTIADVQRKLQRSFFKFRAEELKLYLGKKNGEWLTERDPGIVEVTEGHLTDAIVELVVDDSNLIDPRCRLSEFNFRDVEDIRNREYHLILEFPRRYVRPKRMNRRRRQIAKQRRKAEQPQSERLSLQPLRKWFSSVFTKKMSRRPKKAPWL